MKVATPHTPPPGPPQKPNQPAPLEEIAEVYGDKVSVYEFGPDGKLHSPNEGKQAVVSRGVLNKMKEVFVPSNMPNSVSKDYLATRKWTFARDFCSNFGGAAAAAGVLATFGLDPRWAVLQAPLNMGKERFCQIVGFGTSFGAPKADRNPRAWMMAGETMEHVGMVLEASAPIPGMFLPAFFGGPLVRIVAGSMKGAAMANIDVRQAVADNLGELRAKNGNQAFVSSLLGSVGGLAAAQFLRAHLGPAAYPIVAAAGATLAVGCMAMMVHNLDYQPVNEKALRGILQGFEANGEVPSPDKSVWKPVLEIAEADKVVLGQSIKGLADTQQRFNELKDMYHGRNYMLDCKQGQPYIVLRENCTSEDRFSAASQALVIEQLASGEEFKARVAQGGPEAGDRWLTETSLKKTPADATPMLAQLKKAGWNSDLIRFYDLGNRARWGELSPQEAQLNLDLPVPEQPAPTKP